MRLPLGLNLLVMAPAQGPVTPAGAIRIRHDRYEAGRVVAIEGEDRADGRPGTYGGFDGLTRVSSFLNGIDEALAGRSQPVPAQKRSPAVRTAADIARLPRRIRVLH